MSTPCCTVRMRRQVSTAKICDATLLCSVDKNRFLSDSAVKCDIFTSVFFYFKVVTVIKKVKCFT